jgi:hypothetical protein
MLPDTPPATEPRQTLEVGALALRSWTARQHLAAAGFSVGFALLIGIPTVLIPNPVIGREVPVVAWNYSVWIATSILTGMLAATYVRPFRGGADVKEVVDPSDAPSRFGMAGGVLAWFAPVQLYLAATALVTTAGALLMRLRGQVLCATKPSVLTSA